MQTNKTEVERGPYFVSDVGSRIVYKLYMDNTRPNRYYWGTQADFVDLFNVPPSTPDTQQSADRTWRKRRAIGNK